MPPSAKSPKLSTEWPSMLFFSIYMCILLIALPLYWMNNPVGWELWTLMIVYGFVTGMSITGGYHRLFAHKTYKTGGPMKLFYVLFGAGAFQGSVIDWCSDHRRHHNSVDTDDDPHNIHEGFWWAHMGWLLKKDPQRTPEGVPDLSQDKLIAFQAKYYAPIAAFMSFGIPTLIGWSFGQPLGGFIFGGLFRLFIVHQATFFINSACHVWGRKTYSEAHTARDNVFLALFTFGEGYHSFHHTFPGDYRNGIRWWNYDPTKWMIRFLSYVGWAWDLRTVPEPRILMAQVQEKQNASPHPEYYARIEEFRKRVDDAHKRFEELKTQFRAAKKQLKKTSRIKYLEMKAELKKAKIDMSLMHKQFELLCRQFPAGQTASVS